MTFLGWLSYVTILERLKGDLQRSGINPGHELNHLEGNLKQLSYTPGSSNIAMENGPFEHVFPIKNGYIPLLC